VATPVRILAEDGDGRRATSLLEGRELVVGRGPESGLRLEDRNVSRRHCRLFRSGGSLVVEDLGSANGTRVNGQVLTGRHRLREGDVVEVGDWDLAVEGPGLLAAEVGAVTDSTPLAAMPLPPPPRPIPAPPVPAPAAGTPFRRVALLVAVALVAAATGYGVGRVLRGDPPPGAAAGR
jgi:hypothetical protein